SSDWDKHFKLTADLDLTGHTITPIGYLTSSFFSGTFDGNGHTLANLRINVPENRNTGLFGRVYNSLEPSPIRDLGLINPNVTGKSNVGALVGELEYGSTISNCYVGWGSVNGDRSVGGLCGISYGTISDCYSMVSVDGGINVGSLCGRNFGTISNCPSEGSVTGGTESRYLGGLCGYNNEIISNCYSMGSVNGGSYVGGLCGYNYYANVSNCYSVSSVNGGSYVGGLCGQNSGTTISNCFWDIDTSGQTTSAGGEGKTTIEMMQQATFTDWDFLGETVNGTEDIWRLCEDLVSYPRLSWESPLGDFVCPDGVDFFDYSFFAGHWQDVNCGASNDCDGTDLDLLGSVDINDLAIFVDNWLHTLPPAPASNPNPTDGAIGVSRTADLSWTAGDGATSHDVYFGTNNPPLFIGNHSLTIFDPGEMDYSTTYYWRIDELNTTGITTGVGWSFTTLSSPPPPPPPF
ncbi:MAG: GLUG motif-containing protein, partial [Planctomycetota bacterium]